MPNCQSSAALRPASREAQRCAAVILEVLAGARMPVDAAAALGISPPRYYLWEQRALEGLVRASQRTIGLAPPPSPRPLAKLTGKAAGNRSDCRSA